MNQELPAWATEIIQRLDRIERLLSSAETQPKGEFLTSKEAMQRLGYKSVPSFLDTVKAQGIPYVRINARRWMFEADALDAWIEQRRVGSRGLLRRGR